MRLCQITNTGVRRKPNVKKSYNFKLLIFFTLGLRLTPVFHLSEFIIKNPTNLAVNKDVYQNAKEEMRACRVARVK